MPYIQVEKDGLLYEAEYFYEDGMVTVIWNKRWAIQRRS